MKLSSKFCSFILCSLLILVLLLQLQNTSVVVEARKVSKPEMFDPVLFFKMNAGKGMDLLSVTNTTTNGTSSEVDTTKPRRITAYGIVLIVCACLLPIGAVAFSTIFVCYYGSKEDSCLAWMPKAVVCFGLGLTFLTIVLLPLDVANAKMKGGLDFGLGVFWQVLFGVLLVFVVVVIPFAMFYYESEDPDKGIRHQILFGLIYSIIAVIIFGVVFGVTYYWFGQSYVPYNLHIQGKYAFDETDASFVGTKYSVEYVQVLVSVVVYMVALLSVAGWLVFIVCGGCGLAALPVSCILSFRFRERLMSGEDFMKIKNELRDRSKRMVEMGEKLLEAQDQGTLSRKDVRMFNDYKRAVFAIEKQWKITHEQLDQNSLVILWPIAKLIIGIFFALVSAVLFVHVLLYMAIPSPVHPLLNVALSWLDGLTSNFPAIGAILYGFFSFYFLFCILAGHAQIVSKIPWFTVHPLVKGNTMMSSLLFVVGMLMLGGITTAQFVSEAFASYGPSSTVVTMFNVLVKNLFAIRWFYFVATYVYLAFCLLGLVVSIIFAFCCRVKPENEENLHKILKDLKLLDGK